MKKIITLLLTVSLVLSFSATALADFDLSAMSWGELVELKKALSDEMKSRPEYSENEPLVDDEYVTASFVKIDPITAGIKGYYVYLDVLNNTSEKVTVSLSSASVNEYQIAMVMSGVPMTLEPDKIGSAPFIFPIQSDIADVEQISFKITLRNADTYKEIYTTDILTVAF